MKAQYKSKLNLEDRVKLQDVIPVDTPFLLYIDPSSVCNFKCQFCPSGYMETIKQMKMKRKLMDMNLFKKIIDELSEFSHPLKVLRMNKIGEPLLNSNVSDMVRYAKKSGNVKYIDFATNASLLTHEISDNLIDAGLDRLNISIEGVNSEQYKKICQVDIDFQKIVSEINYFYKIRNKCELVVKIPSNYICESEQKIFLEIFGDCCDRIYIENLTSIWPNFNLNEYSKDIEVTNQSQYGCEVKQKNICSYIFYSMAVNADGTVSACCPDWEGKLIIGDLNTQSLFDIWTSNELRNLQLQHLKGKRCDNYVCSGCGHINYCQVDDIDEYADMIIKKLY